MAKKTPKTPADPAQDGLLASILDYVGSPVFAKDKDHRWIFVNKAFCDSLGCAPAALLGKSDYEFFPKEQADVFWERDNEVFRSRKEDVNEEQISWPGGEPRTILTRKRVFTDASGRDVLVGVTSDITELKKANTELTIFRRLLETSNDAIFIVDPDSGGFIDVNETACRSLGYRRETLLRMGVEDVQEAAAGRGGWKKFRERFAGLGTAVIEGRHLRADGTAFPVEVSVSRAEVEGRVYVLASARDITERKRMEAAMKEVDDLRGLIPICAKCKKIRDDKGFWEKVETYLEKRSSARFTHGLCKDCMKDLYGKESWFREAK